MRCVWTLRFAVTLTSWLSADLQLLASAMDTCPVGGAENGISGRTIGIDIGTSHIRVGVFKSGRVEILTNEQGRQLTPTCVAFTPDGRRLIGEAAKSQATANPANTVFSVFPLLGRRFDDTAVQDHIKLVPYRVLRNSSTGMPAIQVQLGDEGSPELKAFAPEEIVAFLLGRMKELAEANLAEVITNAVVSVPGCFSYAQLRAIRDAGKIAGLNATYIVTAPVSAALAYGLQAGVEMTRRILVFDLGGGCLGVSVISIANGAFETEAQISSCGLGGEKFEQRVMEHIRKLFKKNKGEQLAKRLSRDIRAEQKLRREVEKAVRTLSSADPALVQTESLLNGEDFSEALSGLRFNELNADLYHSARDLVKQALKDADRRPDDIDEIVLVGGSSRIPGVRQMLKKLFNGREPNRDIDADVASVIGAAWQAGALEGDRSVDRLVVLNVCPRGFGYKIGGGKLVKLIGRNEIIPTSNWLPDVAQRTGGDSAARSDSVHVYEGDQLTVMDSSHLGTVAIPYQETDQPDVRIAFNMENFYLLQVSIEDLQSGATNSVVLEHGLSQAKMLEMAQRAWYLADRDRKAAEQVAARERLESLAYLTKRRLSRQQIRRRLNASDADLGDSTDWATAETAIHDVIGWLDANGDAGARVLERKLRALASAVQDVASAAAEL